MSSAMELSNAALEQIGGYVRGNLGTWIRDMSPTLSVQLDPTSLERLIRVEEEMKFLRLDMGNRFEFMDKRFEEVRADMNARFEQVDKRFEETRSDMNTRFEEIRADMNSRFDDTRSHTNRWMTVLTILIGVLGAAMTLAIVLAG